MTLIETMDGHYINAAHAGSFVVMGVGDKWLVVALGSHEPGIVAERMTFDRTGTTPANPPTPSTRKWCCRRCSTTKRTRRRGSTALLTASARGAR